jgi:serine/threonine protein kinase
MAIQLGQRLGPYEILSAIGAGGMGEVYRARDTRLDRTIAIKILPTHLAPKAERDSFLTWGQRRGSIPAKRARSDGHSPQNYLQRGHLTPTRLPPRTCTHLPRGR